MRAVSQGPFFQQPLSFFSPIHVFKYSHLNQQFNSIRPLAIPHYCLYCLGISRGGGILLAPRPCACSIQVNSLSGSNYPWFPVRLSALLRSYYALHRGQAAYVGRSQGPGRKINPLVGVKASQMIIASGFPPQVPCRRS